MMTLVDKLDALLAKLHEAKGLEADHTAYLARRAELAREAQVAEMEVRAHQNLKSARAAELAETRAQHAEAKRELAQVLSDLGNVHREHDKITKQLADARRRNGIID